MLVILFYLGITGCAGNRSAAVTDTGQPASTVLAAWSQIVGPDNAIKDRPLIVARFIVQGIGQYCGGYTVWSETRQLRPSARNNPDPQAFPVTLCQVQLPADSSKFLLKYPDGSHSSFTFSGPESIGNKHKNEIVMVTMGDTGCRGSKDQSNCLPDSPDWPFHELINTAASKINPDLVIHVGDFRYFQEGKSADTWGFWYQDFFSAAQPLLNSAPWAFARGNHEQCHNSWRPYWYGEGWLYLFEATTSLQTLRCPEKPQPVDIAPWYFDIAAPGIKAHRFIMIDTAQTKNLEQDLLMAVDWAKEVSDAWWVSHRPFLSLSYYDNKWHYADDNVRTALVSAVENRTPLCNPDCSPSTVISGHIHRYQKIELLAPGKTSGDWVWPQSVIVGNSGTNLVESLDASPCSYDFSVDLGATGVVNSRSEHGFISWRRSTETVNAPSGWIDEPYFINDGKPETNKSIVPCN